MLKARKAKTIIGIPKYRNNELNGKNNRSAAAGKEPTKLPTLTEVV